MDLDKKSYIYELKRFKIFYVFYIFMQYFVVLNLMY